jgi:hypothetical protein
MNSRMQASETRLGRGRANQLGSWQVMLSADELKAIDDWRFRRRMPSWASAIRELLRLGLKAEGIVLAEAGSKSQDFSCWIARRPSFLPPLFPCSPVALQALPAPLWEP